MSPYLQIEIARARQREIASRTTHSYDLRDVGPIVDRRPRVRPRVVQVIPALGACLAATAALAPGTARAPRPTKAAAHMSARQLEHALAGQEARGCMPVFRSTGG